MEELDTNVWDVVNEETVDVEVPITQPISEACSSVGVTDYSDSSVQCGILSDNFSIEKFMFNPEAIQFYTSFKNYDHFFLFFNILGPAVDNLNYKCSLLSPENQLFLTLMKLRRAKEDTELGILFGISRTVVTQIINTWINFMYFQLKELNIWPEREVIDDTMPEDFKRKFPATRVILDATEVPMQKPSNVIAQCATFSTYKNRNTLKTMIGCTVPLVVPFHTLVTPMVVQPVIGKLSKGASCVLTPIHFSQRKIA